MFNILFMNWNNIQNSLLKAKILDNYYKSFKENVIIFT